MSSVDPTTSAADISAEAGRRRTFAIISHPDAGKTTLTEKFLLYAGAVAEAGAVRSRQGGRAARSDWMAMEQQRGISIASTALQFPYKDVVVNLLDTPGHRDFSEDTYRVLAATDAAIMVLDVGKGIEAQTRKLFEVCRERDLPMITFLNKCDRPGREPLELLDEIEDQLQLKATPVTWPVGRPGDFRGVIDRRTNAFISYDRSAHGASVAPETVFEAGEVPARDEDAWAEALDECSLLDEVGATFDPASFADGSTSPLFVGSALTNFGVRHLLDAVAGMVPSPAPRNDVKDEPRPIESAFSGFVFKVQANMNASHRDRVAFLRVCSGHFERGMTLTHGKTGKPFSTKYAASMFGSERETVDDAYPGDIVGLVNANDVRVGDSLYTGPAVNYPAIPVFAPELFASVFVRDTSKLKKFRKGLEQLQHEGVVQVLADRNGDSTPVLAAVGAMQFEVFTHRLENEFGASPELQRLGYTVACRTDEETAKELSAYRSCRVMTREDGVLLALFESSYFLQRLRTEHPEWMLSSVFTS